MDMDIDNRIMLPSRSADILSRCGESYSRVTIVDIRELVPMDVRRCRFEELSVRYGIPELQIEALFYVPSGLINEFGRFTDGH